MKIPAITAITPGENDRSECERCVWWPACVYSALCGLNSDTNKDSLQQILNFDLTVNML